MLHRLFLLAILSSITLTGAFAQVQQVGSTTSAGGLVTPTGSPYRHIGIAGQPASSGHAAFANGGSGNFGLLNVSQICAAVQTSDVATICAGDSYVFGTQTLTAADTYIETFTAANGCDSTVTLTLTVTEEIQTSDAATICAGESYVFGSQTLTTADTYVETFIAANGCDSTVTLTLTVTEEIQTSDAVTICAGESYTFGSQTLTAANTYVETFTAANGCDSTVTLTLTVEENIQATDAATICAGESYAFGSQTLTTADTYVETFTAANGCDSTVTLTLTVNETFQTSDAVTINSGESYTFGSQTLTTADTYVETFTAANGCDSTVTLTLTVNSVIQTSDAATICAGESYVFGTQTLTTADTYVETFTAASGADSIVTLTLTVLAPIQAADAATICAGESYPFGSQKLIETGVYSETFVAANGCDSIVTLSLTVNETFQTSDAVSICTGESYTFGSQTLTTADTYVETFTAANGCDSTVTLTLTVNDAIQTTNAATICAGDSYAFGSQTLTTADTYIETFVAANGCDSTVTLTLTVNDAIQTTDAVSICTGETYSFGTQNLTATGIYVETFQTAPGCDSTVTLDLTVAPQITVAQTATICTGESYFFDNQLLTEAGQYTATFTTATNCDSTVNLTLTVEQPTTTFDSIGICPGERFLFGSQAISEPGTYTEPFPATSGACDSVVVLTVTLIEPLFTSDTVTICAGESYAFDGDQLTESGVYTGNFPSEEFCDSTVQLTLFVLPAPSTTQTATICAGDSYTLGSQTLTATGTYVETFPTAAGCDSTVTLDLTVASPIQNNVTATICAGESYPLGNQNPVATGLYVATFTTAAGCDSTVILALTVLKPIATSRMDTICTGESYAFGSQNLTATGTYVETFPTAAGCDSTVTLDLNVRPPVQTSVAATICAGESYPFGDQNLTTTGTYVESFPGAGCDSIVTLELTVRAPIRTDLAATICAGESYAFGDQDLTATGVYETTFPAAGGCDSTVVLTLEAIEPRTATDSVRICAGESYGFGDRQLAVSGTYRDTLVAATGCDSVSSLVLTVVDDPGFAATASICRGESYPFGDQLLTAAGTYTATLAREGLGCDSTVTLVLSLIDSLPAVADSFLLSLANGRNVQGNVAANDSTGGAASWSVELIAAPTLGDLELAADGQFSYTVNDPLPFVPTEDRFTYRLRNEACPDLTSTATVRIGLLPIEGDAPRVTGITPNGDGANDFFVVPELRDRAPEFPNNEMIIYNRWGSVVFRAQPYNNDWDGTGPNGRPLPASTYYYLLRLDIRTDEIRQGQVVLVR